MAYPPWFQNPLEVHGDIDLRIAPRDGETQNLPHDQFGFVSTLRRSLLNGLQQTQDCLSRDLTNGTLAKPGQNVGPQLVPDIRAVGGRPGSCLLLIPILGHARKGHGLDGLHTGGLLALGAFFLLWVDSHCELVLESVFQLPRIGKPNERVRPKPRPLFFPIQPVTEHPAFGTALFHQEHKPIAIGERVVASIFTGFCISDRHFCQCHFSALPYNDFERACA